MAINFENALGIHERALAFRSQRAEVLASNLANADTPNYKARDIDFKDALTQAQSSSTKSAMTNTHGRHIQGETVASINDDLLYRNPHQPSIDGNTVEEQVEHAAYMENALDFQTSFTFLNSKFKGLTSAIRGE